MTKLTNIIVIATLLTIGLAAENQGTNDNQPQRLSDEETNELRRIWDYYSVNYENRRRNVAVEMIKRYVDRYPNTPFKAELLYKMGTLYASNANRRFGERPEPSKAAEYYKESLVHYEDYYSVEAASMRGTLASMSHKYTSIDRRVSYYKWLLKLKEENSATSIYPVNTIEEVFELDFPIYKPKDQENFNWDKLLAPHIRNAEKNIPMACKKRLSDLQILSKELEGTPIGEEADRILKENYNELLKWDTYPQAREKFLRDRDKMDREAKERYERSILKEKGGAKNDGGKTDEIENISSADITAGAAQNTPSTDTRTEYVINSPVAKDVMTTAPGKNWAIFISGGVIAIIGVLSIGLKMNRK